MRLSDLLQLYRGALNGDSAAFYAASAVGPAPQDSNG